MARRPDELFDKIKIKKLCSDVEITDEQRNAAKEWLSLLDNGKLESEQQNRPKFEQIILQKILGFSVYDFVPEKYDVDYTISNREYGISICIEVKGTLTKDLFGSQDIENKDKKIRYKETPVDQTWRYMGDGHDYGICTNYNDFILLTMGGRTNKVHKFNFLLIKDTKDNLNEEKLKEFIGIFSKQRIFAEGIVEKLTNESIIAEQEFTDEFYKLFHETRLMLIKEFSSLHNVTKDEAIHWAQIYLNRLIFVFFVEDHNFIPDRLFAKRILSILKSPSISEHTKIISENINDLFKIMNGGSKIHGINGFNGGLFEKEIPAHIFFSDLKDPQFFKEQRQNSKLSQKSLLVDIDINLSSQYADSLNLIIKNLLIMDSYDFTSDLNVNILGHIFEQSISDLESLHEQETTKRKRDGVYYTPEHITDYICRNTIIPYLSKKGTALVSKLVEEYADNLGELENKIRNIKILDPACGSGAFLVKAVDILLEIDEKIQSYKPQSAIAQRGLEEYSKIKEINTIVESNIFGVDINDESVEITKLSLFLKLAGPNSKLTYLSNNIKKGNSLIDDKTVDEHAFCWSDEFPGILGPLIIDKGFDIVIGNPPWVFTRGQHFTDKHKKYFDEYIKSLGILQEKKGRNIQSGKLNLYSLFILRCIPFIKDNCCLGFVIPNNILRTTTYDLVRKNILDTCKIKTVVDLSAGVFKGVTAASVILILQKTPDKKERDSKETHVIYDVKDLSMEKFKEHTIKQVIFYKNPSHTFNILLEINSNKINDEITKDTEPLGDICEYIIEGIVGKIDRDVFDEKKSNMYKPFLVGKNIGRYEIKYKNKFIRYDREKLHRARPEEVFLSDKILVQRISGGNRPLIATYDKEKFYTFASINNIVLKKSIKYSNEYITSVLNSNLINWYYSINFSNRSTLTVNISKTFLEKLPIKKISKEEQKKIIELTQDILQAKKKYSKEFKINNKKIFENVNILEKKINDEIYRIYNINSKTIEKIEEDINS